MATINRIPITLHSDGVDPWTLTAEVEVSVATAVIKHTFGNAELPVPPAIRAKVDALFTELRNHLYDAVRDSLQVPERPQPPPEPQP